MQAIMTTQTRYRIDIRIAATTYTDITVTARGLAEYEEAVEKSPEGTVEILRIEAFEVEVHTGEWR